MTRSMRVTLWLLALFVGLAIAHGCAPSKPPASDAAAEPPQTLRQYAFLGELRAVSFGDSVRVTLSGRFPGPADSTLLVVTDSATTTRWRPDSVRWNAPVPAQWATVRVEHPIPAYPEGSRQVVRATAQAFYKGQATAVAVRYAAVTVPVTPPGTPTIDSMTVTAAATAPWDTILVATVTAWLHDGTRVAQDHHYWTGLHTRRQPLVGSAADPLTGRLVADTTWVDIVAPHPHEPAGYLAFARLENPARLPSSVRGTMPGQLGAWYANPSTNLSLKADSTSMGKVLD